MDKNTERWYALRITYGREMKFKNFLDEKEISNFVPMKYKIVNEERKLLPVVHNLVFARTNKLLLDEIKSIKQEEFPMRLLYDCATGQPLVVPERQMNDFIRVAGTYDEGLIYLDSEQIRLKRGDLVRIMAGPFAGVEGEFVRIKKDRRVVVRVEGVMAVATTFIEPSLVVKL